jgi:hypothetical protein
VNVATLERRLTFAESVIERREAKPPTWASPVDLANMLEIDLDHWQSIVLESTAPRLILLGPRQIGKSTISGLLALYVALTTPEGLVLLVAPSQEQSKEQARTIRLLAARVSINTMEHAESIAPTQLSASRITFPNGSRIIALPGASEATVRGYAKPDVIVVDEASRLREETFAAIRPMLATNPTGRLLLLSTPFIRSGTFYRTWADDSPAWERIRVTTADCPRLTPEYLATERAELPIWVYLREYEGEFTDDDLQVFPTELVEAMLDANVIPLFAERASA